MPASLALDVLGRSVSFDCADAVLCEVIAANFGAAPASERSASADLRYVVTRDAATSNIEVRASDGSAERVAGASDLLDVLDQHLTVALQHLRRDLYFVHAAVLGLDGRAYLFAGASGEGKSTLTWALAHYGFTYLSDELAPLDVDRLHVLPYSRALKLKQRPSGFALPDAALDLGDTIHVPTRCLPAATHCDPWPIAGIVFVRRGGSSASPRMESIGPAEAAARLYTLALNALAHSDRGLAPAMSIVRRVPCQVLTSGELRATAGLVVDVLARRAA